GRRAMVVRAFTRENRNRLVSAWRPFYTYPRTDFIAFKPMFVETAADHFDLRYFAPKEATYDALLAAAREASTVDYWFKTADTRTPATHGFPYSLSMWHALRNRQGPPPRTIALRAAPPEARRAMRYLLKRFYEDSQKYHFTPVAVALPGEPTDFRTGISGLDDLFAGAPDGLRTIDVSRGGARTETGDYGDMFGDTHYSPRANAEVGRVVAAQLRPYVAGHAGEMR